jgi:hypothetical protein
VFSVTSIREFPLPLFIPVVLPFKTVHDTFVPTEGIVLNGIFTVSPGQNVNSVPIVETLGVGLTVKIRVSISPAHPLLNEETIIVSDFGVYPFVASKLSPIKGAIPETLFP